MTSFTLHDLQMRITARLAQGDAGSYTRQLAERGIEKCAQKLGEEAVEAAIAAVTNNRDGLVKESADLLYHLLLVWTLAGLSLDEVMIELERRTAQSGLAEKASRPKD